MSDLRVLTRIKNMAEAAARISDQPNPDEGAEMAAAYERLREDASALHERAGWGSAEDFEKELPRLDPTPTARATRAVTAGYGGSAAYKAAVGGRKARVLLGQLSGWAAGHQEAFEIEERLKADAKARAEQKAKPPTGFSAS